MVGPINDGKDWNVIQPSILTYPDGRLQILCRTRNRCIASAWSKDRGKTWSAFEALSLPNNNSGTDAVTLKDGRQLLVYNHVLPPKKETKGPRTPLNVAVSNDGLNWSASLVLEDSPIGQYSYPSVIQGSDGMIHMVYTWRRERIKYVKIDPSKLMEVPIKKGLWPGTKTAVVKNEDPPRYRVSVCDWMLLKRQKLGAISLARVIGCDGLELDMGSLGKRPTFENALKDSAVLQQFKKEANDVGIKFSSVAMSGFYAQSLAKREDFVTPIQDCIDLMKALNVKVGFLPLGVEGDLAKNPELKPELVKRLRVIGQMAEKAGVVIGIETALDATSEKALLKEIGSKGIQIYFNFQNPLVGGRDLIRELQILGIKHICQIHCTNTDKFWLENDPQINMPLIKKVLDKMGYSGWLVMERSRDANDSRNVKGNYGANARFLKSVFQPE
jgi:alpha-L-rhamnosidase